MSDEELGMPMGKRVGPEDVPPLILGKVKYEAIHWGKERDLGQNGGYIAAIDVDSGKELWILKVYNIDYDPVMEEDVQDIFIESISEGSTGGTIDVVDERGRRFIVDVTTQSVQAGQP